MIAAAVVCGLVAIGTGATGLDRVRLVPRVARTAVPAIALVAVIAGLAVGGIGALGDVWDEFRDERTAVVSDDPAARLTSAAGTRADVWDTALDAFSSQPVRGIGPGTFEAYWSMNAETPEYLRDAHSLYLEQMAELGLLGLIPVLVLVGGGLWACLRARRRAARSVEAAAAAALTAAFIVFCVQAGLDWMWEMTAVTALALAALGVVLASSAERVTPSSVPLAVRVAVGGVAVLACVAQVPVLVSTARVRESAEAQTRGDLDDARQLADDAVAAEPWAASPYIQRAAVAADAGDFDAAAREVHEAIDREPGYWRNWLALVQVDLERGDRPEAQRAFSELRRLSLSSAVLYETLPQLDRDPVLEAATRAGCLAYTTGNCIGDRGAAISVSRCLQPPASAVGAIEAFRGGPIEDPTAVASTIGTAPVYYVAASADGIAATWSLTDDAYNDGFGTVVPLDDAAASLIDPGALSETDQFGVSARDPGARAARDCLAGAGR